ncbi:hypothetical protein Syun_009965 [Stephania yunnanensis]|uniref:Uncharacterized protein n=1 Tax=Stephania yunnanensis TaxID=152371 RepID=A0AAP0KFH5_9MAGN
MKKYYWVEAEHEILLNVVDVGDYEIGTCLVIHAVMRVRAMACIFMQDPQQQQQQQLG